MDHDWRWRRHHRRGKLSDQIYGGYGADTIDGGSGNDILYGGAGNDTVHGGDGDDEITFIKLSYQDPPVFGGSDSIDGGSGNDWLHFDVATENKLHIVDISDGGGGRDVGEGSRLAGIERLDYAGGGGKDIVTGGNLVDRLLGGAGNDRLSGGGSNDNIEGGDGNDTISGDEGNDWLTGGLGINVLSGGAGNDEIYSSAADAIFGDDGKDKIILQGSLEGVTVDGGAGMDTLWISSGYLATTAIHMNLQSASADEQFRNIESVTATCSHFDDIIVGGLRTDWLIGLSGSDQLDGSNGDDTVDGGEGSNILKGGAGADRLVSSTSTGSDVLDGGDGVDLAVIEAKGSATFSIDLSKGGTVSDIGNGTSLAGIERLDFTSGTGSAKITGGDYDDVVNLTGRASSVFGRGGNDTILGGGLWIDTFNGGAGDDIISARTDDRIEGGDGIDHLFVTSANKSNSVIDIHDGGGGRTNAHGGRILRD